MKAISIKQPYASLIANGTKDIENRSCKPSESIIGKTIALHASKADDKKAYPLLDGMGIAYDKKDLPRGQIIGTMVVTGFVVESDSPWFTGPYGWTLSDVYKFDVSYPYRGQLGLWTMKCLLCEEPLYDWDIYEPDIGEHGVYCDACYFDEYEFICIRCEGRMPKQERGIAGNLFVTDDDKDIKIVKGKYWDAEKVMLTKGVYEILGDRTFESKEMLIGGSDEIQEDAIKLLTPDIEKFTNTNVQFFEGGHMCSECSAKTKQELHELR